MDDTPSGSVKRLTIANWRERDAAARGFVRVHDGSAQEIAPDEWAAVFLAPQLGADVPRDIVDLLEVARGALCYGVFFYPLYALGSEQVYRVLESALRHRCASAGAPGTIGNFMNMLEWLQARGLINAEHGALAGGPPAQKYGIAPRPAEYRDADDGCQHAGDCRPIDKRAVRDRRACVSEGLDGPSHNLWQGTNGALGAP